MEAVGLGQENFLTRKDLGSIMGSSYSPRCHWQ